VNKQQNWRMPAEWHPHYATQLHWPANRETWPDERLERVEEVYLDIIEALHTYEKILLLGDQKTLSRAEQKLKTREIDLTKVQMVVQLTNDVWARDCGPIFVHNSGRYKITDWEYNAWGGKYPPFDTDNSLPQLISELFETEITKTGMVLEGGSIDTNGEGVLLTTESVLLNPNRNPGMSKHEIEEKLKHFLGMTKVIWLKDGLAGDDTDGHIDDLSRFVNKNTIFTMLSDDQEDVNYKALMENYEILQNATDHNGNPFHIVTLPLPHTRIEGTTVDGSEYVPASYANFYIANGVVLVPIYDVRYDSEVLDIFGEYFPDRDIIGIPCADLVWGQGSIHCITQQLYK